VRHGPRWRRISDFPQCLYELPLRLFARPPTSCQPYCGAVPGSVPERTIQNSGCCALHTQSTFQRSTEEELHPSRLPDEFTSPDLSSAMAMTQCRKLQQLATFQVERLTCSQCHTENAGINAMWLESRLTRRTFSPALTSR